MQQFRCTACGTVTTSSKACPKCGRRSTIVPFSDTEIQSGKTDHHTSVRSRRDTTILFGALFVAVLSSITALILALGTFDHQGPGSSRKGFSTPTNMGPAQSQTGPTPPLLYGNVHPTAMKLQNSTICGMQYCLVTELKQRSAPRKKSPHEASGTEADRVVEFNGTLVTTHCFLTEQAPTKGRLWYVVLSHSIQWKQSGQPTRDILTVKDHTVSLAPGADKWLGDLAAAFRTNRSAVGRRLFYLRETRWGFSLGAPPSAPDPVTLQMALLAATASALVPDPPEARRDKWTDDRPLLLPIRAPRRLWRRITKPNAKLVRWTIDGKIRPAKNATSSPGDHDHLLSLKGVAQAIERHIDKVEIEWQSPRNEGRLVLIRKENTCLGATDGISKSRRNAGAH